MKVMKTHWEDKTQDSWVVFEKEVGSLTLVVQRDWTRSPKWTASYGVTDDQGDFRVITLGEYDFKELAMEGAERELRNRLEEALSQLQS